VNVPDAKQVAVIDREKKTVTATWPMSEFKANFPLALDEPNQRLFVDVANQRDSLSSILPRASPSPSRHLQGHGRPVLTPKLKRLYVSCGEGFVDVIEQRDGDTYALRQRIETRAGARTSFFSSELNEFFLAVPVRGNRRQKFGFFTRKTEPPRSIEDIVSGPTQFGRRFPQTLSCGSRNCVELFLRSVGSELPLSYQRIVAVRCPILQLF